jgi:hypothetical protein
MLYVMSGNALKGRLFLKYPLFVITSKEKLISFFKKALTKIELSLVVVSYIYVCSRLSFEVKIDDSQWTHSWSPQPWDIMRDILHGTSLESLLASLPKVAYKNK